MTFSLSVIFVGSAIIHQSNTSTLANTAKTGKYIRTKAPKVLLKSSTIAPQPYSVDFSTYFSSTGGSLAKGVAVDGQGNIYVTGLTYDGLPVKNAWNNTYGGNEDVFLAKFNSSGYLVYSTYFGGSDTDRAYKIVVDLQDNVFIYGVTSSTNLPVRNAYQSALIGVQDTFLAKFDSNGNLVFATYFGVGQEQMGSLVVDSHDNIFISGSTLGNGLPMKNANQNTNPGNNTGFLAKFDSQGGLIYSTYLGGNLNDYAYGIAIDSNDNAYVVGSTQSSNFPLTNDAFQKTIQNQDAFLSIFNVNGSLTYSTYIGGTNKSYGWDVYVDSTNNIYITGFTYTADFPTTNDAYQSTFGALSYEDDAFMMKFSSSKTLLYSTYLGGQYTDEAYSIHVDGQGNIFVLGQTNSPNFPIKDGVQSVLTKNHQATFITEFAKNGSLIFSSYYGGLTAPSFPYAIGRTAVIDKFDNIIFVGDTNEIDFPTVNAYYPTMWSTTSGYVVKFKNDNMPNQTYTVQTTATSSSSQTTSSQNSQSSSLTKSTNPTTSSSLLNNSIVKSPLFEGAVVISALSVLLNVVLIFKRRKN